MWRKLLTKQIIGSGGGGSRLIGRKEINFSRFLEGKDKTPTDQMG